MQLCLCKMDVYLSKPLPHAHTVCVRPTRETGSSHKNGTSARQQSTAPLVFLSAYGNRTLEYSRFSAPQKNPFFKKKDNKSVHVQTNRDSRWSCTTAKAPYQPTAAASGMKRRIGLARPFGTTNRRSVSVCTPETERREHKGDIKRTH